MINVPKNMNVSGTNVSMLHVFGCYAVDIGVRIRFCLRMEVEDLCWRPPSMLNGQQG